MIKTQEQIALEKQRERLTKRFHMACADYGLIADGDHILIGLSGGKDSLLLTELLGRRAQIYVPRFKVTALHVRVKERDYHTDLSYLQSFCNEAKVPLLIRDVSIPDTPLQKENGRTFATMPPMLQMDKMPLQLIRPLCLIDEEDIISYAAMRSYRKQTKLCPFEHVSSREKVKTLLDQIKALNPEALDSIYGALTNIKTDYLPNCKL